MECKEQIGTTKEMILEAYRVNPTSELLYSAHYLTMTRCDVFREMMDKIEDPIGYDAKTVLSDIIRSKEEIVYTLF